MSLAASCTSGTPELEADRFEALRERMVDEIAARGISDARVLSALRAVPRHLFVPEALRHRAYEDRALPIGLEQTISQPYVVAFMTEHLDPQPDDVVLEIGAGSGYQAAVLAELVSQVYSIELLPELAERARRVLAQTGRENVEVITGDGYAGLASRAPFDAIIVTAAPPSVPQALVEQLVVGGRMVIPVGRRLQRLRLIERTPAGVSSRELLDVRFVPMRRLRDVEGLAE